MTLEISSPSASAPLTASASPVVGGGGKSKWSPWVKKPLWAATDPHLVASVDGEAGAQTHLARHLTLFDLICIGVGATIGSGVFVLCGLVAHSYAGPATFLSWGIACMAATLSGLCYAELAGRFPAAGSSYAYSFIALGELPAVLAGSCMTLEYVFSASAVARSCGDKVVEYAKANMDPDSNHPILNFLEPGGGVNPFAFIISTVAIGLHLRGARESKGVTNVFSLLKVSLVIFMTAVGYSLLQPANLTPVVPQEFGISGVFRGASTLFFGYIGYDEICCVAGEAINPSRNLPRAVIASLVTVTILYMVAAVALTGMVPYEEISETSPFPDGFRYRGVEWASHLSAIGELVTLPLVVLVSIMAQPRLQYAMAHDGLLPAIFASLDSKGNLWWGTLISGVVMIIIATFVPFTYLNDLISAGILIAFSMTDASVILLRHKSPENKPLYLEKLLGAFNVLAIISGILVSYCADTFEGQCFSALFGLLLLAVGFELQKVCARSPSSESTPADKEGFKTPMVPLLPLLGMAVNWYLIAHLATFSLILLAIYLVITFAIYFLYSSRHSVANTTGWIRHDGDDSGGDGNFELATGHKIT